MRFVTFVFCAIVFGCIASQAHAQGRGQPRCSIQSGCSSCVQPVSVQAHPQSTMAVQPSPQPTCAVSTCFAGSCRGRSGQHERRRLFHRCCR